MYQRKWHVSGISMRHQHKRAWHGNKHENKQKKQQYQMRMAHHQKQSVMAAAAENVNEITSALARRKQKIVIAYHIKHSGSDMGANINHCTHRRIIIVSACGENINHRGRQRIVWREHAVSTAAGVKNQRKVSRHIENIGGIMVAWRKARRRHGMK